MTTSSAAAEAELVIFQSDSSTTSDSDTTKTKRLCPDVQLSTTNYSIPSSSPHNHNTNNNNKRLKATAAEEEIIENITTTTTTTIASSSSTTTTTNSLFAIIEAAAAEDKGSRHTMEDASVLFLPDSTSPLRCAHFAVYDGHGGRLAAEYAQKHLHPNVISSGLLGLPRELVDVKSAKKAILEGFRKTDEALLTESAAGGWQDGATAVCVWVLGQTVFIANIGDAKAVVARSAAINDLQGGPDMSNPPKAIVLTREHKAIYPQERARIQKAGGSVGSNGRLQGRLEVSRAFGDRQFKKVGVVATPDVHSFDLTSRDQFIILGCDGLWKVFGPSDAVEFVQKLLKEGLTVATVSRRLVREAVRERGCKDNCTAVVIVFRQQ